MFHCRSPMHPTGKSFCRSTSVTRLNCVLIHFHLEINAENILLTTKLGLFHFNRSSTTGIYYKTSTYCHMWFHTSCPTRPSGTPRRWQRSFPCLNFLDKSSWSQQKGTFHHPARYRNRELLIYFWWRAERDQQCTSTLLPTRNPSWNSRCLAALLRHKKVFKTRRWLHPFQKG